MNWTAALLIFCLGAPSALARDLSGDTEATWTVRRNGETRVYNLYLEQDLWQIDVLSVRDGRLPDKIEHRVYSSREAALESLRDFVDLSASLSQAERLARPLSTVSTESAGDILWRAEHEWSWEWELKFADWVRENVTPQFFSDHRIATDCADVAYGFRWIFARIHKLPAANRIPGLGITFTHESMRREWLRLKTHTDWHRDERFLAALNYLMNLTYTHSLFRDSYPIAITPESFLPGVFHLEIRRVSGHTQFVHRVELDNPLALPVRVVASTVPRTVRVLMETGFWNSRQDEDGKGGFVRFLWPRKRGGEWRLAAPEAMPHFSKEQYSSEFMGEQDNFSLALLLKLSPGFNPLVRLDEGINYVMEQIRVRDQVVRDGFAHCQRANCAEGTADYEAWSTPSRDRQLLETFNDLARYVIDIQSLAPEAPERWRQALRARAVEVDDRSYPLNSLYFVWRAHLFSSDPEHTPERRWALRPGAAVDVLAESLKTALEARQRKIAGNRCRRPADCPLGSVAWFDNASRIEDERLQQWAFAVESYCEYATPENCQDVGAGLQRRSLSWEGQTRRLADWPDEIRWWREDPRLSAAERWGGSRGFEFLNLGDVIETATSAEGLLWVRGQTQSRLFKADGPAKWLEIPNVPVVSLDPGSAEALVRSEGSWALHNIMTGAVRSLPLNAQSFERVAWPAPRRLLVVTAGHVHIFAVDADLVRSLGTFAEIAPESGSFGEPMPRAGVNGLWLARPLKATADQDYVLLDLRESELKVRPFRVEGVPTAMRPVEVLKETSAAVFLKTEIPPRCESEGCGRQAWLKLEARGTVASPDAAFKSFEAFLSSGRHALRHPDIEARSIQLVEHDAQLNVVRVISTHTGHYLSGLRRDLGGFDYMDFWDATAEGGGGMRVARMPSGGGRLEFFSAPEKSVVRRGAGSRVLVRRDGQTAVREFNGREDLLAGTDIFPLGSHPNWFIVEHVREGSRSVGLYDLARDRTVPVLTGPQVLFGAGGAADASIDWPLGDFTREEWDQIFPWYRHGHLDPSFRLPPSAFLRFSPLSSWLLPNP